MRIAPWRLALTGGAIVVLAIAGIGFAAAATTGPAQQAATTQAGPGDDPAATASPDRKGGRQPLDGLRRIGGRTIHVEATLLDKDGNVIKVDLDHGTIKAIASGSITLSEADGSTVVVKTDDSTAVRYNGEKGSLSDLKVGDEIFVQSRVDGGTALAKHIVKRPATATTSGG